MKKNSTVTVVTVQYYCYSMICLARVYSTNIDVRRADLWIPLPPDTSQLILESFSALRLVFSQCILVIAIILH